MEKEILEKEKDIIIARLKVAPANLCFLDGDPEKSYSRDEMINLIKTDAADGIEFVRTEFAFLQAFKEGRLAAILAP